MDSIGLYLWAHRFDDKPGRKTCSWAIINKTQEAQLGQVEWNTGWRQYVFFPIDGHVEFSAGCLRDIAAFCDANRNTRAGGPTITMPKTKERS